MSRIDRMLSALLCLCLLPACASAAESDSLISEDMIKQETANYDTVAVEEGVYERVFTARASVYYPNTESVRVEVSGAKFKEYLVHNNDEVKAGDVLAVFTMEADELALATQRISLERAQEQYAEQLERRQEAIEAMGESLRAAQDRYDRELLTLQIARAKLELEQYIYQQELYIADIQESIAEMEADIQDNTLIAPADGVITNLVYKREGDKLYEGEALITLERTDTMLLQIDNSAGNFRYGMDVAIVAGNSQKSATYTGRVVGADTLLSENRRTGKAYIEVLDYDGAVRLDAPSPVLSVQTYYLENVLTIPRDAAELESGKYYVTKLTDGAVQKRYVNYIMNNTSEAWILQGLEAGESVILE